MRRISRSVCRASHSSFAYGRILLIAIVCCRSLSNAVVTMPNDPLPRILPSDRSYWVDTVNVCPFTTWPTTTSPIVPRCPAGPRTVAPLPDCAPAGSTPGIARRRLASAPGLLLPP